MFKRTITAVHHSLAIATPMFAAGPGSRGDDSPVNIVMKAVKRFTNLIVHVFDDGGYEITVPKP